MTAAGILAAKIFTAVVIYNGCDLLLAWLGC